MSTMLHFINQQLNKSELGKPDFTDVCELNT